MLTHLKQGRLPILLLTAVLALAGIALLYLNRVQREQRQYRQHTEMLAVSYQAAIQNYRLATDIYLRETIRQPAVLQLLERAVSANPATRTQLRRSLHTLLKDSYLTIWEYRLRQLHFHLPDGESFLRFHQPDRYGDKLFEVRPSVRIANRELRTVIGFEAGRIVDGFRYVAPLEYRGRHIGSVETSVPFRSLQQAMSSYYGGREYQLLINRSLVEERLFPELAKAYVPSTLTPDWLVENPESRAPDKAVPLSEVARSLTEKLSRDQELLHRLRGTAPFSVGVVRRGDGYVVSFLPISEVTGRQGAWLVSYGREPLVTGSRRSFMLELAGFLGLVLLSCWLLLRWRRSVAELAEQAARIRYDEALLVQQERVEHEERRRISRELHDGIGQALQAAILRLKLLQQGGCQADNPIGTLIQDLQAASAELRGLVVALRPLPLSGMAIDEAIRWLCTRVAKDGNGLQVQVETTGTFEGLSDSCCQTLFRICQEALQNIIKHAGAEHVQVTLSRLGEQVQLQVADDGCGGAEAAAGGGSGLAIMRERVALARGELRLQSPVGSGTQLTVVLPCH